MKILILHGVDSVDEMRRTSLHHAFFLLRHAPGHDYWLQSATMPLTEAVKKGKFDAIILDTTFLCWRWARPKELYADVIKRKFNFLRASSAVKIALPQDDYDHNQVLESWLTDWKIDVVYTACYDQRDILYPKTQQQAEIRAGYTGLFEPEDSALVARFAVPWRERTIDVGYRVKRLLPYFGWFGMLKSEIADRFTAAAQGTKLTFDISCEPKDVIVGDGWLKFLGQCKFVLGCETGASLIDPVGDIRAACEAFVAMHPDASFEEVEAACFAGQDHAAPFKTISPRQFEAAAAGCAQILVPGDYCGAIQPWEHYLPLEADMSNFDEVAAAMADTDRMESMVRASQAALLENPRFSYAAYTEDVLQAVKHRRPNLPDVEQIAPIDGILRLALQTGERWAAAWPRWWQTR